MTTADISEVLPEARRKDFEAHYAKQDPITWELAEGCSRCGAFCYWQGRDAHELWHKNQECRWWMLSQWPVEHLDDHIKESDAFRAVIASILGFIDPESGADAEDTIELKRDDGSVIHVHEDGTTHDH